MLHARAGMNFVGATLILEQYSVKDAFAIFMFAMKEVRVCALFDDCIRAFSITQVLMFLWTPAAASQRTLLLAFFLVA